MQKPQPVSDSKITQQVNQRLSSSVRAPCKVAVLSSSGTVTLSGMLQYEHQRPGALQAARGVSGVRRVIDQLTILPRARPA
jgi:osmotically-inducible protein OsmY